MCEIIKRRLQFCAMIGRVLRGLWLLPVDRGSRAVELRKALLSFQRRHWSKSVEVFFHAALVQKKQSGIKANLHGLDYESIFDLDQ